MSSMRSNTTRGPYIRNGVGSSSTSLRPPKSGSQTPGANLSGLSSPLQQNKRHSTYPSGRPGPSSASVKSHSSSLRAYAPNGSTAASLRGSTTARIPEEGPGSISLSTATSSKYNPYSYSPAMAVNAYRMSSTPNNAYSITPVGAPMPRQHNTHATLHPDGTVTANAVSSGRSTPRLGRERSPTPSKAGSVRRESQHTFSTMSALGQSLPSQQPQTDIWEEARAQEASSSRYQIDSNYIPSLDNPAEHQYSRPGGSSKTLGDSISKGWEKTKLDLRLAVFRGTKKLRG